MFVTSAAGSFNVNNPAGALASNPFAGSPSANFGWEIVPVVPLPIAIEYIHGSKNGSSHNLTWKVNCTNNSQAKMTLERSSDSKNYSSIYNITATPVRCQQAFNYSDTHPVGGINYYRLKMEDVDGKITYSSIIAILNREAGFEIISVSPNPVSLTGSAILNVTSAQKGRLHIIVTDATGKKVISQDEELIAGSTQVQINFSKLARGTYQITGYTDDGSSKTVQFVK
jgi:hypothetical protein